jgi:hypothetical protein
LGVSVSETKSERRAPVTWELRLFELIPLAPPWVGLLLSVCVYALYLGFTRVFGTDVGALPGLSVENAWASEIILSLLVGVAPTLTVYTMRGAVRDLYDLRPVLRCSDEEYAELRRRITAIRPRVLEVVGLAVGIGAAFQIALEPSVWADGKAPPLGDPTLTWISLRNGLNAYMFARAIYIEIALARAFSTLGNHIATISLLDSAPLAPFGRRGLRSVGLWMGVTLFYSLLYVGNWAADVLPMLLVSFLIFAFGAFLLPVLGAHRRIQQARSAELGRVRAAIQTTLDALLVSGPVEMPGGRLADLVAYEGRIAAVRAWPFDTPTLLRFGFYLALGLGSWFGAALVERGLDTVLR